MNSSQKDINTQADTIIRSNVLLSTGAGMIPFIAADVITVAAVQMDMIRQLSKLYNVDFKAVKGRAIVSSMTSSMLARLGARSLIKAIPVLGTAVGGLTVSAFSGASTFAIGQVFKRHLASGGTLADFDLNDLRRYYKEQFEKGKKVVSTLRALENVILAKNGQETVFESVIIDDRSSTNEDILAQIDRLVQLKEEGVITEEEFERLKAAFLNEVS